jgi:hypothetical protein
MFFTHLSRVWRRVGAALGEQGTKRRATEQGLQGRPGERRGKRGGRRGGQTRSLVDARAWGGLGGGKAGATTELAPCPSLGSSWGFRAKETPLPAPPKTTKRSSAAASRREPGDRGQRSSGGGVCAPLLCSRPRMRVYRPVVRRLPLVSGREKKRKKEKRGGIAAFLFLRAPNVGAPPARSP